MSTPLAPQLPLSPQRPPVDGAPLRESWHVAFAESKCEDVSIVQTGKAFRSGISLYAVADGHNGTAAARHCSMSLPGELERQLGSGPGAASDEGVRRALARAFVATDDAVCKQFFHSGCTLTAAVVSGDTLTIANVGDSKAVLDTGAEVIELTTDHRIGQSPPEQLRLEQAGGRLARLNEYGSGPAASMSEGVGPMRLWPGGIMVGRAIGDRDVGSILLPNPHVRQIKLPPTGARLILASDGLWDAMPAGRVVRVLRNHGTPKAAAMQAVSSVAACRGGLFNDDVTVVVVDFLPEGCPSFSAVCQQFKGRLRQVLSSPALATLVEGLPPPPPPRPAKKTGLFQCFARPVVLEDEPSVAFTNPSNNNPSNRSNTSTSNSLRCGGSERSVRSGVARDPSVRGCKRATSVALLFDEDTADWSAADFGRRASSASFSSRASSGAPGMQRISPSGVLEALGSFNLSSLSSMSTTSGEDESPSASSDLPRAMSLAMAKPVAIYAPNLTRKNSAPSLGELSRERGKRSHGGHAAAHLLQHTH